MKTKEEIKTETKRLIKQYVSLQHEGKNFSISNPIAFRQIEQRVYALFWVLELPLKDKKKIETLVLSKDKLAFLECFY